MSQAGKEPNVKKDVCQKESVDSRISSLFSALLPIQSALSLLGSEVISKLKSLALSDESRDKSALVGLAIAAGA